MFRFLLCAILVMVPGIGLWGQDVEQARALVGELQRGGAVIYWRHAQTDWDQRDEDYSDMTDCARQRNLTPEGRATAEAVGEALVALEVPIGRVLTSVFCRNIDTARLAFGRYEVVDELFNAPAADDAGYDRDVLVNRLQDMLAEPPAEASVNTVIVGHNFNLQFAAGVEIDEGEIAVFRPEAGEAHHLGNLTPAQLQAVAAAHSSPQ